MHILALLTLLFSFNATASQTSGSGFVQIEVHGTSTLHDWDMKHQSSVLDLQNKKDFIHIQLHGKLSDLTCDSDLMKERALDAFNLEKFPNFTFSGSYVPGRDEISGQLTINGRMKDVLLKKIAVTKSSDKTMLSGEYQLNMLDFEVDPPSFLFVTVDKYVTIKFNLELFYMKGIYNEK